MTLDPKSFKSLARFLAPSAGGTLADRAIAENLISPEQMDDCLREQDQSGKPLDEILVARKLIDPATAARLREPPLPPEASAAAAADPQNSVGQYVLVSVLGRGGMADVWKAWDRSLCRWVALKFLKIEISHGTHRIEREGRMAGRLIHPNIIPVHEVGHHGTRPYLIMPLIDGRPLEPPLAPREAVRITREIAEALHYVHGEGIIHRDVKPANILLDPAGRPLLGDFGLAIGENSSSPGWSLSGTPQYASPEQLRGEALDPRTDIYSLGATLFQLVSGRPPYTTENAEEILEIHRRGGGPAFSGIPRSLRSVVRRAMEPDRTRRYDSMRDMSRDLAKVAEARILAILARPSAVAILVFAALVSSGATYLLLSSNLKASDRQEAARSYRSGHEHLQKAELALAGGRGTPAEGRAELAKAVPEFFAALWLMEDHYPEASVGLGRCYELMGQYLRAEKEYLKAGGATEAGVGLARIGIRRHLEGWPGKDWQKWALEHLVGAESPNPRADLIRSFSAGKWAEALRLGRLGIESEPADDLVLLILGWSAREAGSPDESLRYLETARGLRGDTSAVWNQIGKTQLAKGNRGEALRAFTRAIELADPSWTGLPEARAQVESLKK